MNVLIAFILVAGLFLVGMLGANPVLSPVFGIVLPYAAVTLFIIGMVYRVTVWARVPVPFRIPTTCGQQRSLPWIRQQKLENPHNWLTAAGRMFLEVVFFRSLLRNTKAEITEERRLVHSTSLGLWAGAIAMHWALAIVLFRHLRLMTDPVPAFVTFLASVDGFFEIGLPVLNLTSIILLAGLAYLLVRRLANPQVRYISLLGDYFALFLLLAIAGSGFWLRHLTKTDIAGVKELLLSLTQFAPTVPASIDPLFYGHFFLVCVLLVYFPLGKLLHMPGVFLSPTRNLANSNRAVRHINPWDYPVEVHTYEEYEDELREKMIGAGVPVEKE